MKKRSLLMAFSLLAAVLLATSSTLAYLTDTDADVNTMVLGNVQIVQNEQERVKAEDGSYTQTLQPFTNNQMIFPAVYETGNDPAQDKTLKVGEYELTKYGIRTFPNYVDKIVTVTNTGNSPAYVRTLVAVPQAATEYPNSEGDNVSQTWLHWNSITDKDTTPNNGWYAGNDVNREEYPSAADRYIIKNVEINGALYTVTVFTNINPLAPQDTTGPCMAGFYLDNDVDYVDGKYVWRDKTTGEEYVVWDQDSVDILVLTQAVQTEGFNDAYSALNAGFGVVTADNAAVWFGKLFNEDGTVNEDMIGSPGEDNDNNNPPVVQVATMEQLVEAAAAGIPVTSSTPLEMTNDEHVNITVAENGTLKLDLGGKTLSADARGLTNEGVAIISNGTMKSGSAGSYSNVTQGSNASTTYENVNIDAAGGGIGATNGAEVVFNSGSVNINTTSTSGRYLFYAEGEGSVITINGGTFDFNRTQNQKRAYIYAGEGTTVYVTGGTFGKASTRSGYTAGILGTGDVIITGGTFGFDPSAWVADGYVATKDGTIWTVTVAP